MYKLIIILLAITASTQAQTAEEHFIVGTTAQLAGDTDDALEEFLKALAIKPEHPPILFAVAEVHFGDKNYTTSLFYINKAIALVPTEWEYVSLKVNIEKATGNLADALKTLENYLIESPSDKNATFVLSDLYLSQNQADKSIALLRKWQLQSANDPTVLAKLSQVFQQSGQIAQQIEIQKIQLAQSGYSAEILTQLENSYTQLNQQIEFKGYLESLVRKFPADAFLKRRLQSQNATSGATAVLEAMTTDDLIQKARIYYTQIANPQSLEILRNILLVLDKRTNSSEELHEMNAIIKEKDGKFAEAAELYFTLCQGGGASKIENWIKAISLMNQAQNPQRALRIADDAQFLFTGNILIGIEMSKAYLALKSVADTQNSLNLLAATIDMAKSDNHQNKADWAELYNLLGDTYFQQNNVLKAVEMWKKALEYMPNRTDIIAKIK